MRERIDKEISYNAAMQLLTHEFRALGERTSAFLVSQTIFIGAFVLLVINKLWIIALVIAIVGIIFCILHYFSGRIGAIQAFKWRKYMLTIIEENSEATPWSWLYRNTEHKYGGRGIKHCLASLLCLCGKCLLERLPLPAVWLFYPAIFFIAWVVLIIIVM